MTQRTPQTNHFSPLTSHFSQKKEVPPLAFESGGTLQLVRSVSPNHQTKSAATAGITGSGGNGHQLKEPLNLGAEQPAGGGVAVVGGHDRGSEFLDRRCRTLKGVRPNCVGRKKPDLGFGIIAPFWLDHGTDVKNAEPALF